MFWLTMVRPTYQAIEMTPKMMVLRSGVLYFLLTFAKTRGMAPCTDMLRAVRVSGRIVVRVEATAEVSTAMMRNLSSVLPRTMVPKEAKMSSEFFASPAGPANAWAATVMMRYVPRSASVLTIAAMPGVRDASLVSSFTVTVVSQPQ